MAEDLTTRPVIAIYVGTRHRTHLGDVQPLADSMATIGLLHPVVITPDNQLVAGARRLAAAKRLGWVDIPVRVIDVPSLLQAEHDENELREGFTVVERARIGMALEKEIAARNAVKQHEGQRAGGRGRTKENLVENCHQVSEAQKTRYQVGKAVGMSGRSYEKARAILKAAEQDPERYGDLVDYMEAKNSIDKPYKVMQVRARLETIPGNPRPAEWISQTTKDWLELCLRLKFMNDELEACAENAAVMLVQFDAAQIEDIFQMFSRSHALTAAWLEEIDAIRGERS